MSSRNVEMKARCKSPERVLQKALQLANVEQPQILQQADIFYHTVEGGRLKLRELTVDGNEQTTQSQLIFYRRPNIAGVKLCDFQKVVLEGRTRDEMKGLLDLMGRIGEVRKRRRLVIIGQTRVHVDEVQGLGDFLELEVCLRDSQAVSDGEQIARHLLDELKIDDSAMCPDAYMDMLLQESELSGR